VQAGLPLRRHSTEFVCQTITRPVGYAILRAAGFETVDEVVFAQRGDLSLLGARTLDGFGAVVDQRKKKLAAVGPRPAAA
jgi:predicted aspartyl protease